MAGRGRGGGGRGRGRPTMSFDAGQLGFSPGESIPGPVLQPPPTYPTLEHKPAPLKHGPESEYMLALKRDFIEYLKSRHTIAQHQESTVLIERFSDKYRNVNTQNRNIWENEFDWSRLPNELNPKKRESRVGKRKSVGPNVKSAKRKNKNVEVNQKLEKLAELEKKSEDDESGNENKDEEEKEDEEEDNIEEELEDLDEEMDLGTDYVNNYFDNGENYVEDEDDNLDNGPIY